ncbi:unnamed protein product [Amoebophrya sp. A120]|nr:unnamed protein product [Amoebophrya sp. A120]|eukprot:GSA120T00018613001.1
MMMVMMSKFLLLSSWSLSSSAPRASGLAGLLGVAAEATARPEDVAIDHDETPPDFSFHGLQKKEQEDTNHNTRPEEAQATQRLLATRLLGPHERRTVEESSEQEKQHGQPFENAVSFISGAAPLEEFLEIDRRGYDSNYEYEPPSLPHDGALTRATSASGIAPDRHVGVGRPSALLVVGQEQPPKTKNDVKDEPSVQQQLGELGADMATLRAMVEGLAEENKELRANLTRQGTALRVKTEQGIQGVRDLLALSEVLTQWILTYLLALARLEYTTTAVFLLGGYLAVLVGIFLPTRLVFFPLEYQQDVDDDQEHALAPADEHPTRGDDEQRTDDNDEAGAKSAGDEGGTKAEKKLYYVLPWNFAYVGTLSSVTQRQASGEGKIFTACMVINEVCVLLSRYTMVVYESPCRNPYGNKDGDEFLYLASPALDSAKNLAIRVTWLILPRVLMLMTAAIPSASFEDAQERDDETETSPLPLEAVQEQALPDVAPSRNMGRAERFFAQLKFRTREDRRENQVSMMHDNRSRKYMLQLHRAVLLAMALLLIFETRQLVSEEQISIPQVLFGYSRSYSSTPSLTGGNGEQERNSTDPAVDAMDLMSMVDMSRGHGVPDADECGRTPDELLRKR